ncbi:hypothetical protein N9Z41_00240 [bacterium]|nr:hypothetical protein [bacterium]
MATWKKVAVSGSDISQFNNDAGYLTPGTLQLPNGFSTGSFAGTDILANAPTGSFSVVSGSGAGLKITADAGTRTATFTLDAVPNSSLANSTVYISGSGISNEGSVALGATASIDVQVDDSTIEISGDSLQVKDGGIGTAQIADSLGTIGENSFTGSFSGSFTGDVDIDLADLTEGAGITAFSYDGNSIATVAVSGAAALTTNGITKWSGDAFVDSSLTDNGSTITGNTSIQLTGANSNLTGSFSGSFKGDGSGLTGTGGASIISGDAADNQVAVFNSTNTIAGYSQFIFDDSTNTLTVTGDQLITGDLTVQGTASFQNTTELQVADRFILMASGSTTAGDGGIVIQQGTQNIGEVFGFDSATTRFGLTGSFDASNTSFTPDAFMAAVVEGTDADPDNAPARYNKKGNIFVGTDEGIWIYS